MSKKDFTNSVTNVADKFFSKPTHKVNEDSLQMQLEKESNNIKNDTNITKNNKYSNNTQYTHVSSVKNKSKHYDKRGKREERYGLLLDKQLKEDLKDLANASGSRSINDFIVTILLEYVETPKSQQILKAYNELQKLKV